MPIRVLDPMLNPPLFPLSPEITRVILGGGSFIDQPGVQLPTQALARDFALNYGYDVELPMQRDHLVKVFEDALSFMEEVILDGMELELPPEFCDLQNPVDLLVWASKRPMDMRACWSCSLLRVMHTLFHLDNNVYLRFLPEIQQQIFDRYERYLVPTQDGGWLLKGQYEVPLLAVKRKESKNRVSMLLKLLHKPENVAETIYDQIGIRLVAEDLLGVLASIRFLLDHHVLMATHIKPSRTRNLMVDIPALERWMAQIPPGFTFDQLEPKERKELLSALTLKIERPENNPFSSSNYSAVQFTAQTLIRLPSPAVSTLEEIQSRLHAMGKPEMGDLLHIPELIQEQDEFTFFFAHEVQVMERTGFESILSGPASHAEYKLRQREAARRRVLQGIAAQEAPC
jgi:uncharacterized protein (TIGR04562 family)